MDAQLSREIITLDGHTCRGCGKMDLIGPPHHIKYRSEGGSDDPDNLITLCMSCDHKAHHGDGKHENRRSGRQVMLSILEKLRDKIDYRWEPARQWLLKKVGT